MLPQCRSFLAGALGICLGAFLMTPARSSQAQPEMAGELALDFTWSAPEGCPTRAEVVAELGKAVDAGGKELPPLAARAVVQREGAIWRLELTTEMDGRRGTRLLEADSCEGLARAATLVLALTVGEGLERRRQAEADARTAPSPSPPTPTPPRRVPEPSAPPPLPATEPSHLLLWAAAAVGSDPLGAFGPALVLGVGFQPSLLRLGARLEGTLPRSTEFAGSGAEVQSFSVAADLELCVAPSLAPFQFSACANGGLTVLDARGRGSARDQRASIPLYGIGPSVGAQWLFHDQVFLNVGLLSRFFLARPELVIEGLPQRRKIESASLSAELGGGVRW